MIDEKKLIGELDAWWETLDPRTNARDSIICDVIESVIAKINVAEKVGEWIPVSERLPNPDTYVLVTYKDFDDSAIGVDRYCQDIHDWLCFEEGVIAWMPLPELYKEEV